MAIDLLQYTNLQDYFKIPDNLNLAKNTRAKLFIQRCPNTNFFCSSFTIPDMSIQPVEISNSSYKVLNEPGEQFLISALNFNLLLDESMESYVELLRWFRYVVTNGDVRESYSNAIAVIFNSEQKPVLRIKFYNLFPMTIGELAFNTSEDEIINLPIVMSFLDIEIEVVKSGERLFQDFDESFFMQKGQSFNHPYR